MNEKTRIVALAAYRKMAAIAADARIVSNTLTNSFNPDIRDLAALEKSAVAMEESGLEDWNEAAKNEPDMQPIALCLAQSGSLDYDAGDACEVYTTNLTEKLLRRADLVAICDACKKYREGFEAKYRAEAKADYVEVTQ
jgi:hypothetical protein